MGVVYYRQHPEDRESTVFTGVCLSTWGGGVYPISIPLYFHWSPIPFWGGEGVLPSSSHNTSTGLRSLLWGGGGDTAGQGYSLPSTTGWDTPPPPPHRLRRGQYDASCGFPQENFLVTTSFCYITSQSFHDVIFILFNTRKSSCVNARGIPPAA